MLRTILGWSAIAYVFVMFVVNGSVMLVSPKAWFRMPNWICVRGSMIEARYGSGRGAIQVRTLGAVMVAVPIWITCDYFFR
jgi:hypothetical protein